MMSNPILSIIKQFEYYKMLKDKTFEQVVIKDIQWQYNNHSNSMSSIAKHIVGST